VTQTYYYNRRTATSQVEHPLEGEAARRETPTTNAQFPNFTCIPAHYRSLVDAFKRTHPPEAKEAQPSPPSLPKVEAAASAVMNRRGHPR
jgi:hypothetical protein